jgi:hypothetical protein
MTMVRKIQINDLELITGVKYSLAQYTYDNVGGYTCVKSTSH